ncbi:type II secretion system protein [Alienimonas chondri]|uniref:Prepilin-type N-terminal cleavage/methylation domain-containing protein n=1 Tax=Alienimonas chondri TaxID=2681879 RepID=A0ABX1VFL4_9PLAN|nr:prepilin-type N-terminal cleavage/methylation domain-containing protein [Alienimonas chondri]NNJ26890.1 hypothetical protein [Alienimonas chondri]
MISRPQSPVTAVPSSRRGGFTLVELLVVIGVISLLLALLVPAVMNAAGGANDAAVRAEMSGMEAALSQFHAEYGRMPPSYLDLRRTSAGKFVDPATMSTLRGMFGTAISETAMIGSLNTMSFPGQDVSGAGDYSERGILRGAECLVLFLGGLPASGDPVSGEMVPSTDLAGWSKNPRDPFNASAKSGGGFVMLDKARRTKPFYMFEPDRLKYVNEIEASGDTPSSSEPLLSYFTYLDRYESQTAPMIYASSDGGRGYLARDVRYGTGVFLNDDGTAAMQNGAYTTPAGDPINPNGYQIISPGIDAKFGVGGTYSEDDGYTSAQAGGVIVNGGDDNITNFSSGLLGD